MNSSPRRFALRNVNFSHRLVCLICALGTCAGRPSELTAQQAASDQQAASEARPPSGSPAESTGTSAQAAFDAKFVEYKEQLRRIEDLRAQYQVANEDQRPAINSQLGELVAQTQPIVDDLVSLGVAAYEENPENKALEEFLVSVARHYVVGKAIPKSGGNHSGGDQYERALPILAVLAAHQAPVPQLPVWGLVAAFATNQFDLAAQYYEQAKRTDALGDPGSVKDSAQQQIMGLALQFGESIDTYRSLWEREQQIRQAEAEADDLPRVKLKTTKGDIVLELFENQAPEAVANFITLVKQGFYRNVPFHRVLPAFMAQGGDPTGTGSGGPGYAIRCECQKPDHRKHFRGTLSMAHAGRDTGGSQFFLTFVPTSHLDGRHTAFGRVIDGMDVLGQLQRVNPQGAGMKPTPDRILEAEVLRDRGHAYEFEKLPGR